MFEILSRVDSSAYQLALPPALSAVHSVFHVLILRKYVSDESHILNFTELGVALDLTIVEWPVAHLGSRGESFEESDDPLREGRMAASWRR